MVNELKGLTFKIGIKTNSDVGVRGLHIKKSQAELLRHGLFTLKR
jgi:hypothetical protein